MNKQQLMELALEQKLKPEQVQQWQNLLNTDMGLQREFELLQEQSQWLDERLGSADFSLLGNDHEADLMANLSKSPGLWEGLVNELQSLFLPIALPTISLCGLLIAHNIFYAQSADIHSLQDLAYALVGLGGIQPGSVSHL